MKGWFRLSVFSAYDRWLWVAYGRGEITAELGGVRGEGGGGETTAGVKLRGGGESNGGDTAAEASWEGRR